MSAIISMFQSDIFSVNLEIKFSHNWLVDVNLQKVITQFATYSVSQYIMAGCAVVVAKEVCHHRNSNILKLWEWLNDKKQIFLFKFNYINKHRTWRRLLIIQNWDVLTRAIFLPIVHWWADQERPWLLRTLAFRIIWIHRLIRQWLSIWWLALPNNLLLLIINFSFIC